MIAPQLKNFEGLESTEVHEVSKLIIIFGILLLIFLIKYILIFCRIKVQIMKLMYPEASILLFLGRCKPSLDIPISLFFERHNFNLSLSSWRHILKAVLQDIAWLKSITKLPIMLKGVLTREDGNLVIKTISCLLLVMCKFYLTFFGSR